MKRNYEWDIPVNENVLLHVLVEVNRIACEVERTDENAYTVERVHRNLIRR